MDQNKKIIIALSSAVLILLIGFVGMTFYSMGLKKGQQSVNDSSIQNPTGFGGPSNGQSGENGAPTSMYIKEKEKQPEVMTGKIDKLESDKLVLAQIASIDLKYEVQKGDVNEVVVLSNNPKFNKTKFEAAQAEMEKLLPRNPANQTGVTEKVGTEEKAMEIPEEVKKKIEEFRNDPELRTFEEKKGDWSSLKTGQQVNILKQKDGTTKLVVYPDDFKMGPEAN